MIVQNIGPKIAPLQMVPRQRRRTQPTLPYWQQRLRWAAENAPSPECREYLSQAARGFRGLQQAASLVGWQPWPLLAQLLARSAQRFFGLEAPRAQIHGFVGCATVLPKIRHVLDELPNLPPRHHC